METEEDPRDLQLGRADVLEGELRKHPGMAVVLQREMLARSLRVLEGNGRSLLTLLAAPSENEDLAVELLQNVRPPLIRVAFDVEVSRHLQNYVASVGALVDHQRKVLKSVETRLAKEFEARKAPYLTEPEVRFIGNLRNFNLHYDLPPVTTTIRFSHGTDPDGFASEFSLGSGGLLVWDGWSAESREWIEHQGSVDLPATVRRHLELTVELNKWFINELSESAEPLFEQMNMIQVEIVKLRFQVSEEEAHRMLDEQTAKVRLPLV